MQFAKSCDYAVQGLLFLARHKDHAEPVMLRDIAAGTRAPEAFLSKVFQMLRASSLVRSHRGVKRGYTLAREPDQISLAEIISATDGPAALRSVPRGRRTRKQEDPFLRVWSKIEDQLVRTLEQTTLRTILDQAPIGRS